MADTPERSAGQGGINLPRSAGQGMFEPTSTSIFRGGGQGLDYSGVNKGVSVDPQSGKAVDSLPERVRDGRDRPWESDLGFTGLLENLRRLIRVQPVIWEFASYNTTPLPAGGILDALPEAIAAGGGGGGAGNIPIGGIIMWSGTLITIPANWGLCDGTTYGAVITPDLRGRFVKGAAAGVDPGGLGGALTHTHTVTPTGTVSQPTFTGNALATHGHTVTGSTSSDSAGTSSGTVSQPTFTGNALGTHIHLLTGTSTSSDSAGTPSGTVSQPIFLGSPLATHFHTADGTLAADVPSATVPAGLGAGTAGSGTHTHDVKGNTSSDSAGTPAGTVSQPTFTGNALGTHSHTVTGTTSNTSAGTPSGTVSQPTFTGNLNTTNAGSSEPEFYEIAYIMRVA